MGEIGDMMRAMMRAGEAAELEATTEAAPLVRGGFIRPGRRDALPRDRRDTSEPKGIRRRGAGRRATMTAKRAGGGAPVTPEAEDEESEPTT